MTLRLGDTAPDFTADSTAGPIAFHEYLGDGWGILFSHPRDFTPVCTTELGYVARAQAEFDKRHVKAVGSPSIPWSRTRVGPRTSRRRRGIAPNFPIVADPDRKVADLYG